VQPLIVSYSGIRGIAGESLTEEVAHRFGRAFGRLVTRRHASPTILLGRDTRPSGPGLLRGAMAGLAPFGRLVDLGVVATPTLQFALGALSGHAALCITASHNPAEWNGLKLFLAPDHTVLDGEQIRELRAEVEAEADAGAPPAPGPAPAREERHDEAIRRHVEAALAQVDAARIRTRRLRVALDCAGGAGQESTQALLVALGCEVVPVASGRESEPVAENLGDLRRAVAAERCDLGLAQDLDGDRLALVTEEGLAPGEESTLVLAVDHLLRRARPGCVVVKNVATTRAVDDVAARHGAALVRTPVGEVNLSRALLRELRAGRTAFGGEGNGGVIYPPVSLGRDALVGAALVLESLAAGGAPLSARLAALPRYHGRKLRVPLAPGVPLDALLARIEAAFPGGAPGRLDGLELAFPGGSWFVARASNTEPILRVVAESPDVAWLDETLGRVLELLGART
jgi:phosphomannomutase